MVNKTVIKFIFILFGALFNYNEGFCQDKYLERIIEEPFKKALIGKGIEYIVIKKIGSSNIVNYDTLFLNREGYIIKRRYWISTEISNFDKYKRLVRYYGFPEYYDHNRLIVYDTIGGNVLQCEIPIRTRFYEYDSSHISYKEKSCYVYNYGSNGRLISIKNNQINENYFYHYDENNNISLIEYFKNAKLGLEYFYEYRNNCLSKIIIKDSSGRIEEFYFNEKQELLMKKVIYIDNYPVVKAISEYIYHYYR